MLPGRDLLDLLNHELAADSTCAAMLPIAASRGIVYEREIQYTTRWHLAAADDHGAIVTMIAQSLGESDEVPLTHIKRIVRLCGSDQALAWLAEAQAIESNGGLALGDGSRRRTPGGVYFKHVKMALQERGQKALLFKIFYQGTPNPESASTNQPAPPATAALPAATWADRSTLASESKGQTGRVTSVKVTVIGRPGKVVERQGFTLIHMTHTGNLPPLPRGIPAPTQIPETSYVVFIGAKQWRTVAEAIKNPEDLLIVEGSQIYDPHTQAITVFAINTTTRLLQRARRQASADS